MDVLTKRERICGKTTHGGFICTKEPDHRDVCAPFVDGDIEIDPDGKVWIMPTPSEGAKMRMLTDVLDEKNTEIESLRAQLAARDAEITELKRACAEWLRAITNEIARGDKAEAERDTLAARIEKAREIVEKMPGQSGYSPKLALQELFGWKP